MRVPFFIIAISATLALILFRHFAEKERTRKENRQDRLNERKQELLDSLENNMQDKKSNNDQSDVID